MGFLQIRSSHMFIVRPLFVKKAGLVGFSRIHVRVEVRVSIKIRVSFILVIGGVITFL